jgi:hypothetical protein
VTQTPPHINSLEHIARQTGDALRSMAPTISAAVAHLAREEAIADGYPTTTLGDGGSRGDAELTSVERAAEARYRLRSDREQLRDDVNAVQSLVISLGYTVDRISRYRVPRLDDGEPRCSPSGHDGAEIPWVRYSRDAGNGWADPLCTAHAEPGGLCIACRKRKDRWRAESTTEVAA